jgi:hypothetical protein
MLELTPSLGFERLSETGAAIAAVQHPSGAIPECPEGLIDPWNHIEAAMSLDAVGLHAEAERAYGWSRATQRSDGAWAAGYIGSEIVDHTLDANFTAYIAFGVWHHYVFTGDRAFLAEMWPMVDKAIAFTLALQREDGAIGWARDHEGRPWTGALLTSCSCIAMSLRSAERIALEMGRERAAWSEARHRLVAAIRTGDQIFEAKTRFSMDWYYPVLARAVEGEDAERRLQERWDDFVVSGLGARCVSDRPWVTAGESAELALALWVAGMAAEANLLLEWAQHLRAEDGAYWIGATFPEGTVWPRQKPTWGSGSVILAADVLARGPSAACF